MVEENQNIQESLPEDTANISTTQNSEPVTQSVVESVVEPIIKEQPMVNNENKPENVFLLKDRFSIDFNNPLTWLDINAAKAFEVTDRINSKNSLFALICDNSTSARNSIIDSFKDINHTNIMKLVEHGVVKYPLENSYNMALIYNTPIGGKIIEKNEDLEKFTNNGHELKNILTTFVSILETLKSNGITHRSIRVENLYYNDLERTEIVLGDCLASFPAFHQPPAYESLESLMVLKEGRGDGGYKDDVYSSGVTALSLFLGKFPFENLSVPEVLRAKLKDDSYHSITKNDPATNKHTTIFKKILDDNKETRWSHIDIYNAIEKKAAQKIVLKTLDASKKSITINGEKLYSAKTLAFAIVNNQKEAIELINDGKIIEWVKTGLQNEELYNKLEKTIKFDKSKNVDNEIIVAKVAIMLNHDLPIFFKNLAIFPDAISKALFYAIKKQNGNLSILSELISSDLFKTWYQEQKFLRSPTNISDFKLYISNNGYGYGLNRVIYELDQDLPCTSPLLGGHYITSHTRILRALDSYYANNKTDELPYDKDLISFIYSRMGKNIDKFIIKANLGKENERIAAIIKIYALMQSKYGPAKLPNLTRWLIGSSSSIIKSYHNLKYRKYIEKEIVKVMKNGNLNTIYNILNSDEAKHRDSIEYSLTINNVNNLIAEKSDILNNGQKIVTYATATGKKFAAIVAVGAMVMSFIINLIKWI